MTLHSIQERSLSAAAKTSSKSLNVSTVSELRFLLKKNQIAFDRLIEVITELREQLESEEEKLFACLAEEHQLRNAIATHKQRAN